MRSAASRTRPVDRFPDGSTGQGGEYTSFARDRSARRSLRCARSAESKTVRVRPIDSSSGLLRRCRRSSLPSQAFHTAGVPIARDALVASAGLDVQIAWQPFRETLDAGKRSPLTTSCAMRATTTVRSHSKRREPDRFPMVAMQAELELHLFSGSSGVRSSKLGKEIAHEQVHHRVHLNSRVGRWIFRARGSAVWRRDGRRWGHALGSYDNYGSCHDSTATTGTRNTTAAPSTTDCPPGLRNSPITITARMAHPGCKPRP